jgi:hypothetical protein
MKRTRGSASAWRCTMSTLPSRESLSTTRISATSCAARRRDRHSSSVSALSWLTTIAAMPAVLAAAFAALIPSP